MRSGRALLACLLLFAPASPLARAQEPVAPPATPRSEPSPDVAPDPAVAPPAEPATPGPEAGPYAAPAPESAPPASPPPWSDIHVPPGYGTAAPSAPPGAGAPPTAEAAPAPAELDAERARKQALRDRMRLTVGVGLAYTLVLVDVDEDGYRDINEGWAVGASVGGRYHFARFGSFQARALLLGGGYVGDRDYGLYRRGGQVGALAEATLRFVGYPFYLGVGATVGFMAALELEARVAGGGVGEIGVIFGRDEQLDLGIQLVLTNSLGMWVGTFAWSFGGGERAPAAPGP